MLDLSFMSCTFSLLVLFFVHVRMVVFIWDLNRCNLFFRFLSSNWEQEMLRAEFHSKRFLSQTKLDSLHIYQYWRLWHVFMKVYYRYVVSFFFFSLAFSYWTFLYVNLLFSSDFHDDIEHQIEMSVDRNKY